jgi:arylsulfatase
MIASWPEVIKEGTTTDHISVFYDVLPTLAEVAKTKASIETDGISFLPVLKGEEQMDHEFIYWEFPAYGGQMAVRMGNWKALRKDMNEGNQEWGLFDLDKDPREELDVSHNHPDIIQQVNDIVAREHTVSPNPRWRYQVLGE